MLKRKKPMTNQKYKGRNNSVYNKRIIKITINLRKRQDLYFKNIKIVCKDIKEY